MPKKIPCLILGSGPLRGAVHAAGEEEQPRQLRLIVYSSDDLLGQVLLLCPAALQMPHLRTLPMIIEELTVVPDLLAASTIFSASAAPSTSRSPASFSSCQTCHQAMCK
jgi:hypothetical protein